MRIGIRADGGSKMGMGHIMRTLVLAKELKRQNNDVFYICRVDSGNELMKSLKVNREQQHDEIMNIFVSDKYKKGIDKVILEGFEVCFIREDYIVDDINNITADMLITDSYDIDEDYFDKTKTMFSKTVYIDDINLYHFNVDFLINQNIDAEDFIYRVNNYTKLMLGTEYVMLREEFKNVEVKSVKAKARDIMITLGGADPYHVTYKFLTWINKLDYNFHVVVGPSFENIEALRCFESDRIKLYYNADMVSIMRKCDMAISACGSTLYELAACGVPTIGVIIADNQLGIGEKLSNMGIIKNLGWHNKIDRESFIDSLTALAEDCSIRNKMSREAKIIIDGKGAERITNILMSS